MKRGGPLRRTGFKVKKHPHPDRAARRDVEKVERWNQARAEVADRRWCEAGTPDCPSGRHPGSHAHHVLMRSQGGPDEPHNLLWVCPPAHRFIHANPSTSYERGWLRRRAEAT